MLTIQGKSHTLPVHYIVHFLWYKFLRLWGSLFQISCRNRALHSYYLNRIFSLSIASLALTPSLSSLEITLVHNSKFSIFAHITYVFGLIIFCGSTKTKYFNFFNLIHIILYIINLFIWLFKNTYIPTAI